MFSKTRKYFRLRTQWMFLLTVLGSTASFAQYPGFKLVASLDPIKKQFSAHAGTMFSIKSNFTQEKNLSLLSEKINSEGKFWFKRADKIRLEYTKPYRYLVILNQGQAMIRDEQQENKIPAQASRALRQVNNLLADVLQGKILDNSDFSSRVFQGEHQYLIELSPRAKALGAIYKNINIFVEQKDFTVSAMELWERNGDNTVMRFIQKELNAELSDNLFSVH